MPCHISRQNNSDYSFPKSCLIVFRKIPHEIVLILIEDRESLCRMEVLLDALVIISQSSIRDGVDVVPVVEPVVTVVMTH